MSDLTDVWPIAISHVRHATSDYNYGFQHYRTVRDSVNNLSENSRRYNDNKVHYILDFMARKKSDIIASGLAPSGVGYNRVYYARSGYP